MQGVDVLGAGLGVGDFVPWLNIVGKVAGGLGGGGDDKAKADAATAIAIKKALEEQAAKQAREKAEAEARTTRMILYGVLGVTAVGGMFMFLGRRK
jgi:hypothetical protein